MHFKEHEVISASVLEGRIPPCSSYGDCCCAFQQSLSRTQVQRGAPSTALQAPLRSAPIYLFPCDQEELQVDPGSDPVSASHQGASCSIPIAVPYCFYKLVILSPSGAVVSKEAKSRRTGI